MEHHLPEHLGESARQLTARYPTLDYFVRRGALSLGPRGFEYRGHRFEVRSFGTGWRVFIYTPGSGVLFTLSTTISGYLFSNAALAVASLAPAMALAHASPRKVTIAMALCMMILDNEG